MSTAPTLFDALRQRDEALAQLQRNTSEAWRRCAYTAVEFLCQDHATMTSADVWEQLEAWGGVAPHDRRAMANVMLDMARAGWLRATADYRATSRAHGRPMRVWEVIR